MRVVILLTPLTSLLKEVVREVGGGRLTDGKGWRRGGAGDEEVGCLVEGDGLEGMDVCVCFVCFVLFWVFFLGGGGGGGGGG